MQDQQVGAVPKAQPRSAERTTDGRLAPRAQPLVAEHGPQRVVQPATVRQVSDREARLVETRLLGLENGEVADLAFVHGEGGGSDGGRPPDARPLVVGAHPVGAGEAEDGRDGRRG